MQTRAAAGRRPGLLGALLLALILYAALDHGAVTTAAGARLEVVICLIAAVAAVGLIWTRRLAIAASRQGFLALGLLAAFALWCAITLAWSAAPDATWIELDRVLGYLLILGLAFVVGASDRAAPERFSAGFLLVSGLVTLYALGQKLFPEVHLGSLIDLNQAGPIPRLEEPLGYWNALALFIALGIPAALLRVVDRERPLRTRLVCLGATQLMLVALGFTLSRGGVLALALGLTAAGLIARTGLRTLMWGLLACLGAVPPFVLGLSLHALSRSDVALSRRAAAGALLALVVLLSLAALIAAGRQLARREVTTQLSDATVEIIRRALGGLAVGLVLALLVGLALSTRGFSGEISHAWHTFTANPTGSVYDPQHLLSEDSEHRWVWWKEAAGAFSDRPLGGWGAGSFPVVHLLYRRDLLSVTQPHSLPLQFLAETGIGGGLLGLGALTLLVLVGARAVRRAPSERERLLRAALLAGALAFLIQSLYDWDWDIPALTIPALAFLGVLAGTAGRERSGAGRPQTSPPELILPAPPPRLGARAAAVAACALALCVVALSAALPSLAAGDAAAAIVAADAGPAGLKTAQAEAVLASRLDPLSDTGLRIEATIAQRRGNLKLAQADLRQALARQPTDFQAWEQLAEVELLLDELDAATQAAERALALDPRGLVAGASAFEISQIASLLATPPRDSATAIPLPAPSAATPPGAGKPAPSAPPSLPVVPLRPIVPGITGTSTLPLQQPVTGTSTPPVEAPAITGGSSTTGHKPVKRSPHRTSSGATTTSGGGGTSTTYTYPAPQSTTTTPVPVTTSTGPPVTVPTTTTTSSTPPPPG